MPDWGEVSEDLFVREFGNPAIHSEIGQPIPNCGPSQGVQDILRRKFPGYDGKVKTYVWKLKSRWCEAFIVSLNGTNRVIDALSWDEDMKL